MKLTNIMYFHDTFHFAKDWGVTHVAQECVIKKPLKTRQKVSFFCLISWNFEEYIKKRNICDVLPYTTLLVQIAREFDRIWESYGQKHHPELA